MNTLEKILSLILAIYTIIKASNWSELNPLDKGFFVLAIIIALVVAYNSIKQIQDENKKKKKEKLKEEKELLIEKINSSFGDLNDTENAKKLSVAIGKSGMRFVPNNETFTFKGFQGKEDLFKAFIKNDKLFVNIVVRDVNGEVIAAIFENTWTIFDNNYEYNNDETAFELVSKGDRKVFLNIELFNAEIIFEGAALDDNGKGLFMYGVEGKGTKFIPINKKEDFTLTKNKIKPLFKYPRQKYFGIRN
jgi:hypothetical protein